MERRLWGGYDIVSGVYRSLKGKYGGVFVFVFVSCFCYALYLFLFVDFEGFGIREGTCNRVVADSKRVCLSDS